MIPGWSERDRRGHDAMRQEWLHANRRDGPESGARTGLNRVWTIRARRAASVMKIIWWGGRHTVKLASSTAHICAIRTFSFLEQITRGGIQ